MAIGDIEMEPDGLHGLEEIACDLCHGDDLNCIMCEGEGRAYRLIAPEWEIAAAFENIRRQMPSAKH